MNCVVQNGEVWYQIIISSTCIFFYSTYINLKIIYSSGPEMSEASEDAKTIQLLAKGIMEMYEPPLTTINTHLKELT